MHATKFTNKCPGGDDFDQKLLKAVLRPMFASKFLVKCKNKLKKFFEKNLIFTVIFWFLYFLTLAPLNKIPSGFYRMITANQVFHLYVENAKCSALVYPHFEFRQHKTFNVSRK